MKLLSLLKGTTRISTLNNVDEWSENKVPDIYLTRLLKLIPAEVISIFYAVNGVIPETEKWFILLWCAFCLFAVIIIRLHSTSPKGEKINPQVGSVIISLISFIIWLYVIGVPFKIYNIYFPWFASGLMVGWTFLVPYFYKGDEIK